MLKVAKVNEREYPGAAVILRRDRYMDDVIHSCLTPQLAPSRMTARDKALGQERFLPSQKERKSETAIQSSQPRQRTESGKQHPAKVWSHQPQIST